MPCEACNTQFTVFKRKKSCMECRRLYCNQCLVKRSDRAMCKRCVVFTTRPLSKDELLKQKPKDLIYFLQSKHISTTGCIEKEELVNLVLIHCNNSADVPPSGDESCANPFDQIKQTCHNLFTSFTEKIATDLNFDLKSNASSSSSPTSPTQPQQSPSSQQNIFSQPRASRRPSGSYSSTTSSGTAPGNGGSSSAAASASTRPSPSASTYSPPHQQSTTTRPSPPMRRSPSDPPSESSQMPQPTKRTRLADMVDCKCSSSAANDAEEDDDDDDDDVDADAHNEIITNFRRSQSQHSDLLMGTSATSPASSSAAAAAAVAGPSGQQSAAQTRLQPPANQRAVAHSTPDSDDTSSFEELAGSLATAAGPLTDADNWQIIDHATEAAETPPLHATRGAPSAVPIPAPTSQPIETDALVAGTPPQMRRVNRRRSESALMAGQSPRRHFSIDATAMDDDIGDVAAGGVDPGIDLRPPHRHNNNDPRRGCDRCGNTGNPKAIMRRHVARFRRQLQTEMVDEAQMRRELDAFLVYLEQSQLLASSQDGGDEDADGETMMATASADVGDNNGAMGTAAARVAQMTAEEEPTTMGTGPNDMDDDDFSFGEDDGIHVYGGDDPMNGSGPAKQFFNLTDIQSIADLDDLTVKQLKEVLMLNRVDYKGCCEKNELLERVKRLWNEHSAAPAVDQLPSDDLCKICMDAPIECVMLECGHMATCTECGKVLNECPICRQYIVRVVRFFRS